MKLTISNKPECLERGMSYVFSVSLTPAIQGFLGLPLTLKPAILVLYALTALRHLILQVVIFLSRFLVRVHVWHWYVRVGMMMELMSLALVSMGMLGCFRSGASW